MEGCSHALCFPFLVALDSRLRNIEWVRNEPRETTGKARRAKADIKIGRSVVFRVTSVA